MLERNRRLTSAQVAGVLAASTRTAPGGSGFSNEFGFGLVDARAAVDLV